jgi:hypothetical protein
MATSSLGNVVGRVVRTGACAVWGSLMVILGLSTMVFGVGVVPISDAAAFSLGLAGVAGGQFVFMVLVADRVMPRAPRPLIGAIELAAFAVFVVGVVQVGCMCVRAWGGG